MANAPQPSPAQFTVPLLASMGFVIIPFPMAAAVLPVSATNQMICAPAPAAAPRLPPTPRSRDLPPRQKCRRWLAAGSPCSPSRRRRPFFANQVFKAAPAEALAPVEEDVPAPSGMRFSADVSSASSISSNALADLAISGVAHSARKSYTTQGDALHAFNQALEWGGVQVA
ncbi:hypothetical protein B0H10DRAFT_2212755 [Mycena sp. CBHHK59/15]|nr:hypothetical protein B0H10DRAFT_2212755 [Mycena sp. CBHHK59/15]